MSGEREWGLGVFGFMDWGRRELIFLTGIYPDNFS
jgi:hypothetical protein